MESSSERITKLNGRNYQTWKYNVKLVLMEKGLHGFLDGTEEAPEVADAPKVKAAYKTRSEKAYSLIAMNIEPSVQIHIIGTTNPKEAWETLHQQFSFVSI